MEALLFRALGHVLRGVSVPSFCISAGGGWFAPSMLKLGAETSSPFFSKYVCLGMATDWFYNCMCTWPLSCVPFVPLSFNFLLGRGICSPA